jgi:hypothetical protein
MVFKFLSAQEESLSFDKDSVEYLTPQEYAMMLDRNDRFLLRASLFSIGAEWGVIKNFTLLGQAGFDEQIWDNEFALAEIRYYLPFNLVSRSSLNGIYVSTGVKLNNLSWADDSNQIFNARTFYTSIGIQRRFLGNGLADLSLRMGRQSFRDSGILNGEFVDRQLFSSYSIESKVALGLGIALKNNRDLDYDKLCPVVKCHEKEKFLLKVNAAGVLRLQFEEFYTRLHAIPSVAVEQKFGNLPFSAQFKTTLDYMGWFAKENESGGDAEYSEIKLDLEARYYYNLNSRIRNGRTGNSLSANYFALGLTDRSLRQKDSRRTRYFDYQGFYATTGIQRTYGKRLYFDLYIGVASLGLFDDSQYSEVEFMSGANVGVKF